MKILFVDDNIKEFLFDHPQYDELVGKRSLLMVDAANGVHKCEERLWQISQDNYLSVIITNYLGALCHTFGWDEGSNKSNCFIWQEDIQDFMSIDDLTDKDVRRAHNVPHMYLSGVLSRDGQFRKGEIN